MARPKKLNADYFSHDADMRNDPKIKALRRKYGIHGYAIWNMMLEVLTDADFFEYEWTTLNIELLAGDFDVDPEFLEEVIDYCVLIKLLEKEEEMIFSEKLKERFESLLSKRNRDRKQKETGKPTTKTENKEVFDSEKPQSKVKESKVNKSKKEREGNSRALDFLKNEYPERFQTDFLMKYGKQIENKKKFAEDFNDTVDSEKRDYDDALFGRLGKYARNWIENQEKFKPKKEDTYSTSNIPIG